jgi:hypothetical protein
LLAIIAGALIIAGTSASQQVLNEGRSALLILIGVIRLRRV